jgi:hypothetical protein
MALEAIGIFLPPELEFNSQKIPAVIIVDNFYKDPDIVREFALKQQFNYHEAYHKGKRTEKRFLASYMKEEFERLIGKPIRNWIEHGANGVFQYCIAGDELVYHSDLQSYAGILFLTPDADPACGTSLIRSKETGCYKPPNELDVKRTGKPIDQLVYETYANKILDKDAWIEVDRIGNVYNRLVLWDAQYCHAASKYFGDSLENGRLFQLFFFDV